MLPSSEGPVWKKQALFDCKSGILSYYGHMFLRLTKFGLPQIFIFPAVTAILFVLVALGGLAGLSKWVIGPVEIILFAVFIWILSFFRDPLRIVPEGKNLILAPADGKVTDIETIENDYCGGSCVRIGIFLSIFDVHLNRMPSNCIVDKIIYKKGSFKNAMNIESGRVNESNEVYLHRTDEPKDAIIVRQISGAIARRIVCQAKPGENFSAGQLFGMIKFGSRTELYMPACKELQVVVKVGEKVRAGITVAARYNFVTAG